MSDNEPKTLYRYFPLVPDNNTWSDRMRDTLENTRLYCPLPPQLNDPFDCAVKLANDDEDGEASIQGKVNKRTGVLSFSESNDNALMWSHYANGHRGMSLEFDMAKWPEKVRTGYYLARVEYAMCRPLPTLTPQEQAAVETLKKIAFTKHEDWRYEKEWRMICSFKNHCDPFLRFPKDALTGVIFGLRITDEDRCLMEHVIREAKYPNLTIFEASEDHDKFRVNISPTRVNGI